MTTIFCTKLQQTLPALDCPPYPGALGTKIQNQISAPAWQEWLTQQTMLINEHRLKLNRAEDRTFLREQMELFLFGPLDIKE